MKLDPTVMRTMSKEDYKVMEAIEIGMKDHEIVPTPLITTLANLRYGGVNKRITSLHRDKLVSHEKFNGIDGYRLTNAGYDILALYNLKVRNIIAAIGQKIGTGKESDIYLAADPTGKQVVLKFHRLGRTSFRNVRKKRDYFNNAKGMSRAHSWLFLSKLSATKEYAFMKALYDVQYPTPQPLGQNRHIICMGLIRGIPLYQIYPKQLSVEQSQSIYEQAVALATTLAVHHGLVHCDLNEFNLLVDLSGIQQRATDDTADPYVRNSGVMSVRMNTTTSTTTNNIHNDSNSISLLSRPLPWMKEDGIVAHMNELPTIQDAAEELLNNDPLPEPVARLPNGEPRPVVTLIDFPQMISIQHYNAREYYERDMECLHRFFTKKLQCIIPDIDSTSTAAVTIWDNIVKMIEANKATTTENFIDPSLDPDDDTASIFSSALSVTTRRRLDEELKASGYYTSGFDKDLELYYFQSSNSNNNNNNPTGTSIIQEEEEEEEEEDEDNNNSNDDDDDDNEDDDNNSMDNNNSAQGMQPLHSCDDDNDNNNDDDDHSSLGNDDHLDYTNDNNTKDKKQSKKKGDNVTVSGLDKLELLSLATEQRAKLTREEMIELAKQRLNKQIDSTKKKTKLKSATNYKTRNNNKTVTKGKQILTDYGY